LTKNWVVFIHDDGDRDKTACLPKLRQ